MTPADAVATYIAAQTTGAQTAIFLNSTASVRRHKPSAGVRRRRRPIEAVQKVFASREKGTGRQRNFPDHRGCIDLLA